RAERRLDTVFGDHDGAFVAGEIGAGLTLDAQGMVIGVARHHRDSALLEPIREALRHGPDPPSAWSTRSRRWGPPPSGPAAGRGEQTDPPVKNSMTAVRSVVHLLVLRQIGFQQGARPLVVAGFQQAHHAPTEVR